MLRLLSPTPEEGLEGTTAKSLGLTTIKMRILICLLQVLIAKFKIYNWLYTVNFLYFSLIFSLSVGIRVWQKKMYHGYDTKLHLMVRLYFQSSGEYGIILSLLLLSSPLWPGVVVLIRIPGIGHIDLFEKWFVLDRNTWCHKAVCK